MTEKSLIDGFEKLIGAKCDIFAKLLYVKASKGRDHCKLTILDFHAIFYPLMVSLKVLILYRTILLRSGSMVFLRY
jgi:hypothetical protein